MVTVTGTPNIVTFRAGLEKLAIVWHHMSVTFQLLPENEPRPLCVTVLCYCAEMVLISAPGGAVRVQTGVEERGSCTACPHIWYAHS